MQLEHWLKGKVPAGCFFGGADHLADQIFHGPGAKTWHYAAELRTLSVTYLFCVSQLLLTPSRITCLRSVKENLTEMGKNILQGKLLSLYS